MRFSLRGLAVGSTAFAFGGSVVLAPGCGSDDSCEETRSCGGGGSNTEGGAGDSGGDAPKACTKNEDCENGLVCDGVSTCVNKLCVAGTPVECANPDSAHCTATCKEPSGECEVSASDIDEDQHLDPLCGDATVTSSLPADDCDDSQALTHPGAPELCDGADNDCDDLTDFEEDGFSIGGLNEDFVTDTVGGHPAIAWSTTAQKYGVVWEDDRFVLGGDEEVMFALMNPDGTKSGTDVRVSNAENASYWPRIAAGHDSFGIVWGDSRVGGYDIYFRKFDESGAPATGEIQLTTDAEPSELADIVAIPDGWLVVLADTLPTGLIYGIRLNENGGIVKPKALIGTQTGKNTVPRIALAGDRLGILWSKLGSASSQYRVAFTATDFDFNVMDGPLDISPSAGVNTGGMMGDITTNAAGDGFTVAYFNYKLPANVSYGELAGTGAASCGPTGVGTSITDGAVGEVVRYTGGSAFIHTKGVGQSTQVRVSTFGQDCGHYTDWEIGGMTTSEANPYLASAASGEAGVAFVWADVEAKKVRSRVTGPHLCD